jgi:hypothetical protein
LVPDQVVLNKLILDHVGEERLLTFEGKIVAGTGRDPARERPEQILTTFTRRLMSSYFFSDARKLEAGEDDTGTFRFAFLISLRSREGE